MTSPHAGRRYYQLWSSSCRKVRALPFAPPPPSPSVAFGQALTVLFTALGTASKNYARGSGLLTIAHSIFKRYRHEFKSDMLYTEIKYSLDQLQVLF